MKTELSQAAVQHIDEWLMKFPPEQKQSALLAALTFVQTENGGWLTNELIEAVAHYLQIPAIAAFEAVTFYSMYELNPIGRHKVCICTNISCLLSGSEKIIEHVEKRLGIKMGETTTDGRVTLRAVECLAACANAPMLQIGPKYYEDLTVEKVDAILDGLK